MSNGDQDLETGRLTHLVGPDYVLQISLELVQFLEGKAEAFRNYRDDPSIAETDMKVA